MSFKCLTSKGLRLIIGEWRYGQLMFEVPVFKNGVFDDSSVLCW